MTVVHDIGAMLFFLPGITYTILQAVISYQAYPVGCSIGVLWARLGFAIVATLAFFPSILPHESRVLYGYGWCA